MHALLDKELADVDPAPRLARPAVGGRARRVGDRLPDRAGLQPRARRAATQARGRASPAGAARAGDRGGQRPGGRAVPLRHGAKRRDRGRRSSTPTPTTQPTEPAVADASRGDAVADLPDVRSLVVRSAHTRRRPGPSRRGSRARPRRSRATLSGAARSAPSPRSTNPASGTTTTATARSPRRSTSTGSTRRCAPR